MPAIHHTHKKQAEKIGTFLEEHGQFVKAIWPMRNIHVFAQDAKYAVQQMAAAQKIIRGAEERGLDIRIAPSIESPTMVHLFIDGVPGTEIKTPIMWLEDKKLYPETEAPPNVQQTSDVEPKEAEAHSETIEEAEAGEEKARVGTSVVKQKYRAIYTEAGHPTNCGDSLAVLLNNLIGGKRTNLDQLEMIAVANGIDLSKYKRTGNGWQGRLRMTMRNMLARAVYRNGGTVKMPENWGIEDFHMDADWMASQRFAK